MSATDYEDIKIYVSGKARYLIGDEGADAEIKIEKLTVKGKIFREEDDSFRFEVSEDKNGNRPEIPFEILVCGTPVKILSK